MLTLPIEAHKFHPCGIYRSAVQVNILLSSLIQLIKYTDPIQLIKYTSLIQSVLNKLQIPL